MKSAQEALQELRDGNDRFVLGLQNPDTALSPQHRADFVAGQQPFAVVLGCSDSRVPVEIVFDQGLGTLFVIRLAGNIVAPSVVGSVEFAVEVFGTRLVVVLGHSHCGAIKATLNALRSGTATPSQNIGAIVDRIRPAIEELLSTELQEQPDALARHAVRANVRASASQLRHGSQLLERLIREQGLTVVGAEYSLETGAVDFFDGVTEAGDPRG